MITYNWNKEKNLLLKQERNLSFEQVVLHIENGDERFYFRQSRGRTSKIS
jgi:hypothetical protein